MKTTNNLSGMLVAVIALTLCLAIDRAKGQPSKPPKTPTPQIRTTPGKTSGPAKSSGSSSSAGTQKASKVQGSGGGTVAKAARDHNSGKGSKGDSGKGSTKPSSVITADNLTLVGLSPASAAALANKTAHGDAEAEKTAKLVISGSALLQQTGATPEQTTAALEEITKRRLTDGTKGSAFRSVVDGAALKSVLGPDIKLPPGQLDSRVAGSIFDVMGDLAGAGIDPYQSNYKDNIYQTIIDKGFGVTDARDVARDVAAKDLRAAVGRPGVTPFDFSNVDVGTGAMSPGSGYAPGNSPLPGRLGDIYKDPTNPSDNNSGKTQNATSGDILGSHRSGASSTERNSGSSSSGSRDSSSGSSSSGSSSGEHNSGYHNTDDDGSGAGGHTGNSGSDYDSSSSGSSGSNNSSGSGSSGSNNSGSSGSSSGSSGSSSSGSSSSGSGSSSGSSDSGGSSFFDGVDPNAGDVTQEDRDNSWSTPNDKQHEANKETDGNDKGGTERPRDPDDTTRRPTEAEKRQLISGGASMIIGKRKGAQPENPSGGGDDNVWTGGSGPLPDKKGKLLGGDTREPIAARAKPVISSSTPLRKPGSAGPENPSGGGDDSGYQPGNQNSSPPDPRPSVAR